MRLRLWPFALVVLGSLFLPCMARGDPQRPAVEDALEDELQAGDIDEEDIAMQSEVPVPAASPHKPTWVALVGYTRSLQSGQNDLGAMLVVGLALERFAVGRPPLVTGGPAMADPPPPPPAAPAPTIPLVRRAVGPSGPSPSLPTTFARQCVAAALRASGLSLDDARLDALMARSRESAWLPDVRLRAMRLMTDAAHATTLATTDGTTYYNAAGANLVLEMRLTWRFDRLIYAGDEPAFEHARMDRQEARSRLANRTLEALFAWHRAVIDVREAVAGSHEESEARVRTSEAQATLDVLTDGWFTRRGGQEREEKEERRDGER